MSKRVLEDNIAAGCPRRPLAAIRQWRAANIQERKRPRPARTTNGSETPLVRLTLEKLREEVKAKRLKNLETRGRLVSRSAMERDLAEFALRIKTRLGSIPDELEMLLPAEVRIEVKLSVAERIQLILREMASAKFFSDAAAAAPASPREA